MKSIIRYIYIHNTQNATLIFSPTKLGASPILQECPRSRDDANIDQNILESSPISSWKSTPTTSLQIKLKTQNKIRAK